MALNEPRKIPYDFRVFEQEGVAWLFDDSERQYPCTATPHVYAEPLYYTDREPSSNGCDDPLPDPCLFLASDVARREHEKIDNLDADDVCPAADPQEAWDAARDEACANHRV